MSRKYCTFWDLIRQGKVCYKDWWVSCNRNMYGGNKKSISVLFSLNLPLSEFSHLFLLHLSLFFINFFTSLLILYSAPSYMNRRKFNRKKSKKNFFFFFQILKKPNYVTSSTFRCIINPSSGIRLAFLNFSFFLCFHIYSFLSVVIHSLFITLP